MIRRLGLAVLVIAMALAACGRQVTGLNATGPGGTSIPSGQMLIRFKTLRPMDFTTYRYVIVFNTSGNGQEPYPNAFQTGFKNFSYAFVVGGPAGLASTPQLLQYYLQPGTSSGLSTFNVTIPTQTLSFVPNSGSDPATGEFQITFNRLLLNQPNPAGTPPPTAAPVATPTPASGPTPAPTPTAPLVQPTTPAQRSWNINFITTDAGGTPIDSLGLGANQDTSFNLQIDTTLFADKVYTKPAGYTQVSNPAAQVTGYEIINAP